MPPFDHLRPLPFTLRLACFSLAVACSGTEPEPPPDARAVAEAQGLVELRVEIVGDGGGVVEVTPPDEQARPCPGVCSVYVAPGAEVQVAASPGLNAVVRSWSLPECGSDPTCTVRVDELTELQLTLELNFNVAFMSGVAYAIEALPRPGEAANQECTRLAAAAGLHGSRYVAWLSGEGPTPAANDDVQPADFLQHTGGWVRPDGQPVARSRESLLRGELLHPIALDERGRIPLARAAWSATTMAGLLARAADGSSLSCRDWIDSSELLLAGIASSETTWIGEGFAASCFGAASLLCLGDDSDAELELPPSTGRLAFTSETLFVPGGGIASADALCQLDACRAGLTGSSSCDTDPGTQRVFKAYLNTSTQKAWERFDLSGPSWVRADGVPWLSSAADLGKDAAARRTTLNVRADGSYGTPLLSWVGDAAGTATCNDWTSTSGADRGAFGRHAIVDGGGLSDTRAQSCAPPNNGYVIVCLED